MSKTAGNKGFAIAGVSCFADTFLQDGNSVLRMKFSAKTPRHRKPPKRYLPLPTRCYMTIILTKYRTLLIVFILNLGLVTLGHSQITTQCWQPNLDSLIKVFKRELNTDSILLYSKFYVRIVDSNLNWNKDVIIIWTNEGNLHRKILMNGKEICKDDILPNNTIFDLQFRIMKHRRKPSWFVRTKSHTWLNPLEDQHEFIFSAENIEYRSDIGVAGTGNNKKLYETLRIEKELIRLISNNPCNGR